MQRLHSIALALLTLVGPEVATAQDWTGLYAGFGISRNSGTDVQTYDGDEKPPFDLSGNQQSIFAGYNFQTGNMVYGAELALSRGEINYDDFPPSSYYVGRTVQLKGRFGYATGKALWYGSLGLVSSDTHYSGEPNSPIKADGTSFGLGVDVLVGERMILGAELQRRKTSFDEGAMGVTPLQANEHEVNSFAIRVGMKF